MTHDRLRWVGPDRYQIVTQIIPGPCCQIAQVIYPDYSLDRTQNMPYGMASHLRCYRVTHLRHAVLAHHRYGGSWLADHQEWHLRALATSQ